MRHFSQQARLGETDNLIVLGVVGVAGLLALVYGAYLYWRYNNNLEMYNMNPESRLPVYDIGYFTEARLLGVKTTELSAEGVRIESKKGETGIVSVLESSSEIDTVESVCIEAEPGRDYYFEVEVVEHEKAGRVEIGLCNRERLEKDKEINRYGVSISLGREIKLKNNLVCQLQRSIGFGDVVGVGFTHADRRVWLTLNGELLNPVCPSEFDEWQKRKLELGGEERKADNKDSMIQTVLNNVSKKVNQQNDEEKAKLEESLQKLKIVLEPGKYLPAFSFAGKNKVIANFGGQCFRCYQKELEKGVFG